MSEWAPLIAAVVFAVAIQVVAYFSVDSQREWNRRMHELVVQRLGARLPRDASILNRKLDGTWNAIAVRVLVWRNGNLPLQARVEASGLPAWFDFDRRGDASALPWRDLLDARQEHTVGHFLACGGSVSRGTASRANHVNEPEHVVSLLDDVARVATLLSTGFPPLPSSLTAVVLRAGAADARLRAFDALSQFWPEALDEATPSLLADPDPDVRLAAALRSGAGTVLADFVRCADSEQATVAAEALPERAIEPLLVERCQGTLPRTGTAALMQRWGGRDCAFELTRALVGTDRATSRAAKQALQAIRSRLGDVEVGQVSLAAGGGEVSVAATGGELSE